MREGKAGWAFWLYCSLPTGQPEPYKPLCLSFLICKVGIIRAPLS